VAVATDASLFVYYSTRITYILPAVCSTPDNGRVITDCTTLHPVILPLLDACGANVPLWGVSPFAAAFGLLRRVAFGT